MFNREGPFQADTDVIGVIERYFAPSTDRSGWLSFRLRPPTDIACLRTDLVARAGPDGTFLFTLGETVSGRTNRLSHTFCRLCELEGIKVVKRAAPNPSRTQNCTFPGFELRNCTAAALERLLLQLRGALLAADTLARA